PHNPRPHTPFPTRRSSDLTEHIEKEAKRRGITDPWAKAQLGKMTREGKAGDISTDAHRAMWWNRLTPGARREAARAIATLEGGKDRKSTRLNSSHSQISYA